MAGLFIILGVLTVSKFMSGKRKNLEDLNLVVFTALGRAYSLIWALGSVYLWRGLWDLVSGDVEKNPNCHLAPHSITTGISTLGIGLTILVIMGAIRYYWTTLRLCVEAPTWVFCLFSKTHEQ